MPSACGKLGPRARPWFDLREADASARPFGLRTANTRPLFPERHPDTPIEASVAERNYGPVSRGRVVEIGNLVGVVRDLPAAADVGPRAEIQAALARLARS